MVQKWKLNILIVYTVFSAIVTVAVSITLSVIIIPSIESNLINAHSDFYRSFVDAIPANYSEIINTIAPGFIPLSDTTDEEEHHHSHEEDRQLSDHSENVWNHFQTDVSQTSSVIQFRVFNSELTEVWSYNKHLSMFEHYSMIHAVPVKKNSYHIIQETPFYIIHYYFPIRYKGQYIGMVEITDSDKHLTLVLESSRQIIQNSLIGGGLVMYVLLFLLFFQSYRNQNKIINQLDQSQSLTIHSMSLLAELRDNNTGAHISRTSKYCKILAEALKKSRKYNKYITNEYIADIERSAPLHDIGKVGIPDHILNKPGKLTDSEFAIIKKHPEYGAEILKDAIESLSFRSYFEIGYQIVLHHHENWDGSGYPHGLKEDEIPLSARIMAIADVYDALTTKRPYKEAYSHEKAVEIITGEAGKKFDPELIESFAVIESAFKKVRDSLQ